MNLIKKFAVQNPCYKTGQKITPKGVMIHSIGVPQPDPRVIASNFNQPSADSCVHAVIGTGEEVYQLLEWNHRAWHCGSGPNGSGNSTHISFEMTEPSTIRYTSGANWTDLDPGATKTHVMGTYRRAVELTAYLCELYGLNPKADGVLLSHSEGHRRGIASNHGDVEHIWDREGLTMEAFRRDVAAAMAGEETGESSPGEGAAGNEGTDKIRFYVQAGAFAKEENARRLAEQLEKAGFSAYIKKE